MRAVRARGTDERRPVGKHEGRAKRFDMRGDNADRGERRTVIHGREFQNHRGDIASAAGLFDFGRKRHRIVHRGRDEDQSRAGCELLRSRFLHWRPLPNKRGEIGAFCDSLKF